MTANLRLSYFLPVVIVLVLAAIFWSYLGEIKDGKSIQDLPSALIDKPAPVFKLPGITASDKGFDSTVLKQGKVTLVNVWASWCAPCRVEHPRMMQLAREGVAIYGINYKDTPEAAKGFLAELGNPYKTVGADRTGKVSIDWGVYGYPETFVVDTKGHIRYRHVGPIMAQDLTDKIRPLIKALSK
ncbi:MAG: DsbE family thiol:disulfide interchange protein [Alphaproteobacteria bacterium]